MLINYKLKKVIKIVQISDRQKAIEKYIKDNPECKIEQILRVEFKGEIKSLPVYRIPVKFLTYNLENGRFAADLFAEEAKQKRKLDPVNIRKDSETIKRLLLVNNPKETKLLKGDLKRFGQRDTGVITSAGNVINANRRMAVLSELKKETGDSKYDYLEVAILPRSADDKDLWRIEAKLQYGRDFKVKYGPINELLKVRGAFKKGLTKKEVAYELGETAKEVEERLERLKLIEAYLDYIKKPKNYKLIEEINISEHFIDTQNNLKKLKEEVSANELHKFLILHFEAISAGFPHLEVRKLKKFDEYREVKKDVFLTLDKKLKEKIDEQEFKELLEDALQMVRVRKKEEKPVQELKHALDLINKVDELGIKLDSGCKKILSIIIKLAKKMNNNK